MLKPGIGDWEFGIALLVRTLRERLRSVTRDWGLHFWCGRYANGSALLPGIGDWGLGIGKGTNDQ
ncbi:MAG: hypothetical protein ACFKPT_13270 [Gloeotrichia echinulata GP01]